MLIFNPRQTILLTCRGSFEVVGKSEEKHDVVPVDWHSPASSHPPLYAVFLNKGLMAVELIRKSGCFAVNFIPFSMVDVVLAAMQTSGEFLEKCEELGIHEVSCEKIDCFRVKEALGWLECEVVEEKELGDNVMFVGKVLLSQFDRDDKRPFHIEGSRFTTTRE